MVWFQSGVASNPHLSPPAPTHLSSGGGSVRRWSGWLRPGKCGKPTGRLRTKTQGKYRLRTEWPPSGRLRVCRGGGEEASLGGGCLHAGWAASSALAPSILQHPRRRQLPIHRSRCNKHMPKAHAPTTSLNSQSLSRAARIRSAIDSAKTQQHSSVVEETKSRKKR